MIAQERAIRGTQLPELMAPRGCQLLAKEHGQVSKHLESMLQLLEHTGEETHYCFFPDPTPSELLLGRAGLEPKIFSFHNLWTVAGG